MTVPLEDIIGGICAGGCLLYFLVLMAYWITDRRPY